MVIKPSLLHHAKGHDRNGGIHPYLRQRIWFGPLRRKVLIPGAADVRRAEPARRLGANEGQGA
jgi:hypothetical protein